MYLPEGTVVIILTANNFFSCKLQEIRTPANEQTNPKHFKKYLQNTTVLS